MTPEGEIAQRPAYDSFCAMRVTFPFLRPRPDLAPGRTRRRAAQARGLHTRSLACIVAQGLALLIFCGGAPPAAAQYPGEPAGEIVANLAAGRVVIFVAKDAIVVATLENPIEVNTRPPEPVVLASERFGVLLGPVEWHAPASPQYVALLVRELPHLRTLPVAALPHLGQSQGGDEAADIEAVGQAFFERLNQIVQSLHGKLNLPEGEPLIQLIIADYLAGYGPEVWQLSYGIQQEEEKNSYWTTRALNPEYLQVWPPEKGQPHTLLEFDYPPENARPSLLDLLRQGDPRIAAVRTADPRLAAVEDRILNGSVNKVLSADAVQFLRAALDALAPPRARETIGVLHKETGFSWILPPPAPPAPRLPQNRPPEAPTLQPH